MTEPRNCCNQKIHSPGSHASSEGFEKAHLPLKQLNSYQLNVMSNPCKHRLQPSQNLPQAYDSGLLAKAETGDQIGNGRCNAVCTTTCVNLEARPKPEGPCTKPRQETNAMLHCFACDTSVWQQKRRQQLQFFVLGESTAHPSRVVFGKIIPKLGQGDCGKLRPQVNAPQLVVRRNNLQRQL